MTEKKYGTPMVLGQWMMELGRLTSIGPRIQKTRDIANLVDSLITDKPQEYRNTIQKAIDDIESVRSDYKPHIDDPETFMKYYDEAAQLGKKVDDILRPIYKIITKHDLIDPSGIGEGLGDSWGSVQKKGAK